VGSAEDPERSRHGERPSPAPGGAGDGRLPPYFFLVPFLDFLSLFSFFFLSFFFDFLLLFFDMDPFLINWN
jgi:hypothetical protein